MNYSVCFKVPGYLVFGTGQPTKLGFINVLEYLLSDKTSAKSVMWTNMRQVRMDTGLSNQAFRMHILPKCL